MTISCCQSRSVGIDAKGEPNGRFPWCTDMFRGTFHSAILSVVRVNGGRPFSVHQPKKSSSARGERIRDVGFKTPQATEGAAVDQRRNPELSNGLLVCSKHQFWVCQKGPTKGKLRCSATAGSLVASEVAIQVFAGGAKAGSGSSRGPSRAVSGGKISPNGQNRKF
jgi:hypothetical protein